MPLNTRQDWQSDRKRAKPRQPVLPHCGQAKQQLTITGVKAIIFVSAFQLLQATIWQPISYFSMEVEGTDECCELIKYVNEAAEEGSKSFLFVFSKQLMQKEVKFTVKP